MSRKPSVLIVGFGIAGMSAALSLHKAGWEPTIVEKAEGRRMGGYFVGFFPAGKKAARELGVFDLLHFRTPRGSETWDLTANGDRLFAPGFLDQPSDSEDDEIEAVLRSDLEEGLWKAIEGLCDIRFNTVPTQIDDRGTDVEVRLKNTVTLGEITERFDLVVGADGVRSTVRNLVFGPNELFLRPLKTMICAFELDEPIPSFDQRDGIMICEVDRSLWVFPLSDKAPTALLTYRVHETDGQFGRPTRDILSQIYAGSRHGQIIDPVLKQFDRCREYLFDSVNKVVMKQWHKGRVVMLGDAAWCLTLYSGMGATSAMKGAVELADFISRNPGDLETALTLWGRQMRPFIRKHRIAAYLKTEVFLPSSRIRLQLRHLLMRWGTRKLIKRRQNAAAK